MAPHHAIISKTLSKYKISWADYKRNPYLLVKVDAGFRRWWMETFINKKYALWYNNKIYLDSGFQQISTNTNDANLSADYRWWSSTRLVNRSKAHYIICILI